MTLRRIAFAALVACALALPRASAAAPTDPVPEPGSSSPPAPAPAPVPAASAPAAAPAPAPEPAPPPALILPPLGLESIPGTGILRARTSPADPPSLREREELRALRNARCDLRWGLAFPGVGALCTGRTTEGVALVGLGLAELGTGVGVALSDRITNPAAAVPLLAFADLLTAAALDGSLRVQRAQRLPYVPEESLPEVLAAPFRLSVLSQPDVWGGILGTVALGIAFEHFVDGGLSTGHAFERPVLFGRTVNTLPGSLAAGAIGVGLFSHVAAAEELAFRGIAQSALVRRFGEDEGWVLGSLVFGLFHASNAIFLAPEDRVDYLVKSVPFITLVGSYLGWTYRNHGYGLSAPAAVHFWYDFLIEAVAFALDPKNSPLSVAFAF